MTLNEWLKISDRYSVEILDSDIDETRDDLGFWAWVMKHSEIPITITEGAKKAGCLLSNGVVSIALTGVWNGQNGKGSDLKGSLKKFIVPGRPIYLGFDGDVVVKESVEKALIQFGRLCKKAKAEVLIMQWDLTFGKGIDDVVVKQGTEALEKIINEAISYGNWLKGLKSEQKEPEKSQTNKYKRIPKADVIGMLITENHRDRLIYCDELSSWLAYEMDGATGIWEMISKDIMLSIIDRIVESQGIRGYGSSSYIENEALPTSNPIRSITLELLYNLQQNLELSTEQDQDDQELIMRLKPLYQEDRQRAIAEGRKEEAVNLIRLLLNSRFGQIAPDLSEIINQLSVEQLESLGTSLLNFQSESDLRDWLSQQD